MHKQKVRIRHQGPLAKRTGVITNTDVFERADRPVARSREFQDAIRRVSGPMLPVPGVATHIKEWGRWDS